MGVICIQMRAETMALNKQQQVSSVLYNKNRIGPRTDPCGTPHRIRARDEVDEPVQTNWRRPTR